jgi:hypothetical protein
MAWLLPHVAARSTTPIWGKGDLAWMGAIVSIMLGYLYGCSRYLGTAALRDLHDFGSAVHLRPPGISGQVGRLRDEKRWRRRLSGFLHLPIGPAVVVASVGSAGLGPISEWSADRIWSFCAMSALFYLLGSTLYKIWVHTRVVRRLPGLVERVDLFDQRPLRPLARHGTRVVLMIAGSISIGVALSFHPRFAFPTGAIAAGASALALAYFVTLLYPIHRVIKHAKDSEIVKIRRELSRFGDPLTGSGEVPEGRLSDLLAFEARLESIYSWPIDTSSLVRLAGSVAVLAGTAFVGRVVEQLVNIVDGSG